VRRVWRVTSHLNLIDAANRPATARLDRDQSPSASCSSLILPACSIGEGFEISFDLDALQ
jgi:hypothetical protein